MVRFTRSGGLWPPPQSIDIIPQISLLLRVFSHGSHSSCCVYSPTDSTEFTELLAEIVLPQISQIYTELLAACILPQISQNSQNFLLRLFSHRYHRFTELLAEIVLPQISQNSQNFLLRLFSHRFHRIHRTSC